VGRKVDGGAGALRSGSRSMVVSSSSGSSGLISGDNVSVREWKGRSIEVIGVLTQAGHVGGCFVERTL
jgi:hypothetical protein